MKFELSIQIFLCQKAFLQKLDHFSNPPPPMNFSLAILISIKAFTSMEFFLCRKNREQSIQILLFHDAFLQKWNHCSNKLCLPSTRPLLYFANMYDVYTKNTCMYCLTLHYIIIESLTCTFSYIGNSFGISAFLNATQSIVQKSPFENLKKKHNGTLQASLVVTAEVAVTSRK